MQVNCINIVFLLDMMCFAFILIGYDSHCLHLYVFMYNVDVDVDVDFTMFSLRCHHFIALFIYYLFAPFFSVLIFTYQYFPKY